MPRSMPEPRATPRANSKARHRCSSQRFSKQLLLLPLRLAHSLGGRTQRLAAGDGSRLAPGDDSRLAAGDGSRLAAGDGSSLAGRAALSGAHRGKHAGGLRGPALASGCIAGGCWCWCGRGLQVHCPTGHGRRGTSHSHKCQTLLWRLRTGGCRYAEDSSSSSRVAASLSLFPSHAPPTPAYAFVPPLSRYICPLLAYEHFQPPAAAYLPRHRLDLIGGCVHMPAFGVHLGRHCAQKGHVSWDELGGHSLPAPAAAPCSDRGPSRPRRACCEPACQRRSSCTAPVVRGTSCACAVYLGSSGSITSGTHLSAGQASDMRVLLACRSGGRWSLRYSSLRYLSDQQCRRLTGNPGSKQVCFACWVERRK